MFTYPNFVPPPPSPSRARCLELRRGASTSAVPDDSSHSLGVRSVRDPTRDDARIIKTIQRHGHGAGAASNQRTRRYGTVLSLTAAATADLTSAAVARVVVAVVGAATGSAGAGRGMRVRKLAASSLPSRRLIPTALCLCSRHSRDRRRPRDYRSRSARRRRVSDARVHHLLKREGEKGGKSPLVSHRSPYRIEIFYHRAHIK